MLRGGYRPALLPVLTPQGPLTALVFCSNPAHDGYIADLSLHDTARIIATAEGAMGTNRDYLAQLARQLATLGIEDDYIARLQHLVALHAPATGAVGASAPPPAPLDAA